MSVETVRWSTRIALAQQRGHFNKYDWRDATGWQRCSVAEHAPDFEPDAETKAPLDTTLYNLGIEFSLAVKANDFARARTMNNEIESYARSLNHTRGLID